MEIVDTASQVIADKITEEQEQILKYQFGDFIKIFAQYNLTAGVEDTPKRMLKMYKELLTAEKPRYTLFDSNGYDEMIVKKDIPFFTFCEHHVLPFYGTVKIGYIPKEKIIGLSKLTRMVNYFSKRLNTQEYFTQNICNELKEIVRPFGCGVIAEGIHLCELMRGVKGRGTMVTSALYGDFKNQTVKEEFIKL